MRLSFVACIVACCRSRYDSIGMVHHLLSILLASGIVACPLLCKGGSCCFNNAHSAAKRGCCSACCKSEDSQPADHKSIPNDRSHAPAHYGGCICAGAVIEDAASQHVALTDCTWMVPPASQHAISFNTLPNARFSVLLPDDGRNQGRAMRCMMSSYLC
jgi:hypothetical protein